MVLKEAVELLRVKDISMKCLMRFTWKIENFFNFQDIMKTRKIFSEFFDVGGCELRIGAHESFDTICIYLESGQPSSSSGGDPEKNFLVHYRMGICNQKEASRSVWRESLIYTKTWSDSALQFMTVQEMMNPDSGFLDRDSIIFVCEILDYRPLSESSDPEVFASEDEKKVTLMTEPDSSEEVRSTVIDTDELFRTLLISAGFHLPSKTSPSSQEPSTFLLENVLDTGAFSGFLTNVTLSLNHLNIVKQILPPGIGCTGDGGACTGTLRSALQDYPAEIINLIKLVLRSSLKEAIVDLFLDTMVECCEKVSGSTFWGCSNGSTMEKMPDQSAKLFAMIINLIKSLDSSVQGLQDNSPVRKRHPRSVLKKVSTLLEKAPWQFKPDIVSIVPKLVDPADHTAAASLVLSLVAVSGYELTQQEEEEKEAEAARFEKLNKRAADSEAACNLLREEKEAEAARFEKLNKSAADSEAAYNLLREEKEAEAARFEKLNKRAADSEAACNLLREEKKAEAARFEKLNKRAADFEATCNLLREEKKAEAARFEQEKELLEHTAAESEAELRMKGFKVDFLKSVNDFIESEKETSLLHFQASMDNVMELQENDFLIYEAEKSELQEQVTRSETYINYLEGKLNHSQQLAQTLMKSLHDVRWRT